MRRLTGDPERHPDMRPRPSHRALPRNRDPDRILQLGTQCHELGEFVLVGIRDASTRAAECPTREREVVERLALASTPGGHQAVTATDAGSAVRFNLTEGL
ncbi:hypothetical protein [Agromyces larvae]|uniref:Uncharacterized protein n=1 Tax=Agromyces larvae TaxID=2929802 RepID=A0ABY4C251_9MICO|nr:hypothetical protein [Agromyces larvae]UOE45517.1 hypothetical protein MTO99_07095 [Agromyces larvae]